MEVVSFTAVDAWINWVKANHPELVREPGKYTVSLTVSGSTDVISWETIKRNLEASIRKSRRLHKYQRRARWGQVRSRKWKPWFGKKSK